MPVDTMTSQEEDRLRQDVTVRIGLIASDRERCIINFVTDRTDELLQEYIKIALERFDTKSETSGDHVLINKHFPYFALLFLRKLGKDFMAKNAIKYMSGNPQKPEESDPFMDKYGDLVQQLQEELEVISGKMANLDLSTYLESRVSYSRDGMNLSGHGYDARDFPTLCVLGINSWSAESVEIASVREKIANTLLTESQEQFK